MNKKQLAERLARQSHRSRAQAADSVDKLVYGLLKDLRSGESKDVKPVAAPAAKFLPAPGKEESTDAAANKKKDRS